MRQSLATQFPSAVLGLVGKGSPLTQAPPRQPGVSRRPATSTPLLGPALHSLVPFAPPVPVSGFLWALTGMACSDLQRHPPSAPQHSSPEPSAEQGEKLETTHSSPLGRANCFKNHTSPTKPHKKSSQEKGTQMTTWGSEGATPRYMSTVCLQWIILS